MQTLKNRFRALVAAAGALACACAAASPTNFSFTGSFADDDDVQLFSFVADGVSAVRLITYGYAGGVQANGNVVTRGGFDPILALFDSNGLKIGQNDDADSTTPGACGAAAVNFDPLTTVRGTETRFDTCLDLVLAAGSYTVSIAEYANFALGPNLADGFTYNNAPTFTSMFGCAAGQFCDSTHVVAANSRSNRWAFDVLNVNQAALQNNVPEPATALLAGIALTALGLSRCGRPGQRHA